jgi:hypothetical protein
MQVRTTNIGPGAADPTKTELLGVFERTRKGSGLLKSLRYRRANR